MRRHFVCAVVCLLASALESVKKICRVRGTSVRRAYLGHSVGTPVLIHDELSSKIRSRMRLTMHTAVQTLRTFLLACRTALATTALGSLMIFGFAQSALAQAGTNPLTIFKNYFVTGDYVVAGWVEGTPDGTGFAPGLINLPDTKQPDQTVLGVPAIVPAGADIVGAYLYWATVESNQSSFAGKQAFFNTYSITGTVLGNPNAPTSWSAGGCSGSSNGSKTMRTYRADVRPYLPLDLNPNSPTFGAFLNNNASIPVRLADSGSNGNTAPNALGATLVLIYRVLSPPTPLNAIVLYDGAFAPSNATQMISQTLSGFYQPSTVNPAAKITHIVANGQLNKGETVSFGSNALKSLYTTTLGSNAPPFPGIYGTWDNPTWLVGKFVNGSVPGFDTSETTSVVPSATNSGCVSWGTIILSTTVQDTDNDGLIDAWEQPDAQGNQGYTDAVSGQWVALPGADPLKKDIFVEVDYLTDLSDSNPANAHSHLPKQAALDGVAAAFSGQHINVHFDLGPGIYQSDTNVITYPVPIPNPLPTGTLAPQAGSGGKAIPESALLCQDGATLCAYPNQPAVGWKGDFVNVQNSLTLGNFQPGRGQSYHYVFFGHSLGAPRSFWSALGSPINTALNGTQFAQLDSISVTSASSNNTTITIHSPQGVVKPGDCFPVPPLLPPAVCSDLNNSRLTITGSIAQPLLNGTYSFTSANVTQSTIIVTTAGVAPGTYSFSNDPQLAVTYLGPTSTSGHSDFGGGGDSAITLGLWGADDPVGCIADPSLALTGNQVYCNNQVGTLQVQTGTLMHELGHSLSLTHGGTYYHDPVNLSLPTYELNCKPNFVSVMNYLFQVRGFVDNGGFDYSGQTMPVLNEAYPSLSESTGIGSDLDGTGFASHLTRWYSTPNALDVQLQNATGGRYATAHCDGTPLLPNEPNSVRVDGTVAPGGTFSAPLDWNNDLVAPSDVVTPGEDLDHNGAIGDSLFSGYNDWKSVDFQQMGARPNAFGSSGGGVGIRGGGVGIRGGGTDNDGGGVGIRGGGVGIRGGGVGIRGGGVDQDEDTATSTVSSPSNLTCSVKQNTVPGCVVSSGIFLENAKSIPVSWTAPAFGQIRTYFVWRAVGSFTTSRLVLLNGASFTKIATVTGMPPSTSVIDSNNIKNNTTYTYFVTNTNKQGVQSGPSTPLVVTTKF
jgi:hypothetical protein